MDESLQADVCVVGAGYAGLTAALRCHQAGKSVVVLEARQRVGGRIWTEQLPDGTPVDRGGAWLGPAHLAMFGLAQEFGVGTYKTWVEGAHLLVEGNRLRHYHGLIPKISPLAIASIAWTQAKLDRTAKKIPLDRPWEVRGAAEWDESTVKEWFDESWIHGDIARSLFDMAVRGLFTGPLDETSFLHLLFLVKAHGSINTLFSIEKGCQETLIDGGAGSIAARMAERLGEAVRLGCAARSITQTSDQVHVEGDGLSVSARRVVVAVPPALALDIVFQPALTEARLDLYRSAVAGPESKTLVVYETPFWRDLGLSGQSAGPGSASEVTIDASPLSGAPGVLASFTFGEVATRCDGLQGAERKRLVLEELTQRFGEAASSPTAFVETPWWHEQWTRGCSMAHFPPGQLTRNGALLTEPFGRVHWAGTETSTLSHGAMDGAVRSGERAASEVVGADP